MNSRGHVPLISPWLFRLRLRQIVHRATAGDIPAVLSLTSVFCTSNDPKARSIAEKSLRSLSTPGQVDALCCEVLLRDCPPLVSLACEQNYLPSAVTEQALFLFCSHRLGELDLIDPENHHPVLATGYAAAPETIQARARSAARSDRTCGLLARALATIDITRNTSRWSYDEWEVVVTGFIDDARWDDLWLIANLAPIPLALTALTALKHAGWVPSGDSLMTWRDVSANLPERWTWPVPAGHMRDPVGRPAGQVTRLSFSPDGSLFAMGCCDGRVQICRTTTTALTAEFATGTESVRILVISPDNTRIVYDSDNRTVHCCSLLDQNTHWSWGCPQTVTALSYTPDGRSLLIGTEQGDLNVISAGEGELFLTISPHPSRITCMNCTPDGTSVACGHADGTISVVNPDTSSILQEFPGNGDPVHGITFDPKNAGYLAVYEQTYPALWDLATGAKMQVFKGHAGRTICCVVSVEAGWFAIGSDDRTLRTWNWHDPAPTATVPLYNRHITCCSATLNGCNLVAGFHDGTIKVFTMPGTRLLREYKGHKKAIISCGITPDDTRLATVSWDGTTKLWELPKGKILRTLDTHNGGIADLAGPAGSLIATVTIDGIARILDSSTGTVISTINLYTPLVRSAAMSADGTYLASTGANATLRIWNIRDGSLVAASEHLTTSQRCCTFLPTRSSLVTGGWDGICRIFSIPEGVLIRTLSGHTGIVTCCATSRDGSLLITGSNDTTVRLWRIAEDLAYAVLTESRTEVSAVALSPDETTFAAGGADGVIRIYRLPYGTSGEEHRGLPGKITTLAFTRDGCTLAVGYDTGICAYLSLTISKIIHSTPAHNGAVTGMVMLQDTRTLVSTGGDGLCRFHPLPHTTFLSTAGLPEIALAEKEVCATRGSPDCAQWSFLRTMLATRFCNEIEICPSLDVISCYDIQIVG